MSINKVFLVGNITRAEVKAIPSGTEVLEFGIAVDERYKDGDEWKSRPNFFDCTKFNPGRIGPMVTKGRKVAIEGRLKYRQWESSDGTKRSKVEVTVNEIALMDSGRNVQNDVQSEDNGLYEADVPF